MSLFIHHAYFTSKLVLGLLHKGKKKHLKKESLGLYVDRLHGERVNILCQSMYLILLESYSNKTLLFWELLKHPLSRKKVKL